MEVAAAGSQPACVPAEDMRATALGGCMIFWDSGGKFGEYSDF